MIEGDSATRREEGERGRKRKLRAAVGQVRATRYDRPHGDGRRDISSRIEYLLRESNSTQPQSVTAPSPTSVFPPPPPTLITSCILHFPPLASHSPSIYLLLFRSLFHRCPGVSSLLLPLPLAGLSPSLSVSLCAAE